MAAATVLPVLLFLALCSRLSRLARIGRSQSWLAAVPQCRPALWVAGGPSGTFYGRGNHFLLYAKIRMS